MLKGIHSPFTYCSLGSAANLTQAELLLKLASLQFPISEEGKNTHFIGRLKDDLPKEVKGAARWYKAPNRDWSYVLRRENQLRYVEYINDTWYWIGWNKSARQFYTNHTNYIEKPELLGLGTKSKPTLQEKDRKRIEKVPAIDETSDGHEAGPSRRTIVQEDTEDTEDQPIGDAKIDDDLSTLIGTKMTTTETTTATMTQQTLEALIRGGGPVQEDNPMRLLAAIADEVRNLQGQNLYGQGGGEPPDDFRPPARTFETGRRPGGGGPPGGGRRPGGPPGSPGGGPLGGPPGGNNNNRDWNDLEGDNEGCYLTGKINGHVNDFDGDRTKARKFQNEFGIVRMLNPRHQLFCVPMQRTALALSYIKGDAVDEWCHEYADHLADEVYQRGVAPTNE